MIGGMHDNLLLSARYLHISSPWWQKGDPGTSWALLKILHITRRVVDGRKVAVPMVRGR